MKWIALQLLRLFELIVIVMVSAMAYFKFTDEDPSPNDLSPLTILVILAAYVWVIEQAKTRLRRQMFQKPRKVKAPPPQPIVMPKPEPLPEAPQKPAERRFAPIPLSEGVEAQLAPSRSALAPSLRQFIERGEQAIQDDPDR